MTTPPPAPPQAGDQELPKRKLTVYISQSLDGYIATENDGLDWLDEIPHGDNDYGYVDFTKDVDTYIVGRKTYDVVMNLVGEFAQSKQYNCYVLSRTKSGPENGVTFYNGNVGALISKIRSREGKNIYCDGGGEIVRLLMELDLIDEYIISVMPTILGKGKRLFHGGVDAQDIKLIESTQYENGVVQLKYARNRDGQKES